MKSIILNNVVALAIATSSLILISGCQTPGKVVSTLTSEVCPTCKNQTVTTPIKGLKYTRHVCPSCETTEVVDPQGIYDEMGPEIKTVHVCKKCSSIVEPCPLCKTK
jgi:hypothetical protein